ncbi:MAG: phosphomannomutase [Candidatus Micrarchaeota archaeon]|nr:MAG: phosphomannomutase [Candidatus Micrarchaeota archaeon]
MTAENLYTVETMDKISIRSKKLVVSALNGPLIDSKTYISPYMNAALDQLLRYCKFGIISGESIDNIIEFFLSRLTLSSRSFEIYVFASNGASLYRYYNGAYENIYEDVLLKEEKDFIKAALEKAIEQSGLKNELESYKYEIQDRQTQITLEAVPKSFPIDIRKSWDPDRSKREKIASILQNLLTDYSIRIGGYTSIDITRAYTNKGRAILKLCNQLGITKDHVLYIGKDLEDMGNDIDVLKEGIDCIKVDSVDETVEVLRYITDQLSVNYI